MATEEIFNKAAENVKMLKSTPADDDLLELYSFYKQATVGDCNTEKPGFLDFKGKAKWDAWNRQKGMSSDDARTAYVAKANSLAAQHGLKD